MMSREPLERSTAEQLVAGIEIDRDEPVATHVGELVELRLLDDAVFA